MRSGNKCADVHLEMTLWQKVEDLFCGGMVMLWRKAESTRTDIGRIDKNRCWGKARLGEKSD